MAKKFGKFLLATAAIGTAAVAAYMYLQKKDSSMSQSHEDDDYDDFSDDLEDEDSTRTYVSLTRDSSESEQSDASQPEQSDSSKPEQNASSESEQSDFTPLSEQVNQAPEEALEASSEEFFDEDDLEEEYTPSED